jgi:Mg-chelatase subunit ChlD
MARVALRFAGFLLLAYGFLAAAQTAPTLSTRSLLVNVLDQNGNAVRDLTKDGFRAKVNGRPATVVEARYSLAPRRIVVLLDMSGSMAGETEKNKKWQIARQALEDLIAETPADVKVALLTFSSQVHDVFDFSQSRSSMAAWLKDEPHRRAEIKGRTALYDAVLAATKLLEPTRSGDAIYVITDGGDNSSHISETGTRKLLLQSRIRLFVFLLAEKLPMELERTGKDSLIEIARATGGFVFGVAGREAEASFLPSWNFEYDYDDRTRERIRLYTEALNIQVNGFYTLQLETPLQPSKLRKVLLEIVDARGQPRKDVAFTYSTLLPPQPK